MKKLAFSLALLCSVSSAFAEEQQNTSPSAVTTKEKTVVVEVQKQKVTTLPTLT
jgi:hypothetical protein